MLREISFYYKYQVDLRNSFNCRYLLIKEERIVGDFGTWQEASRKGLELWGDDSFFIKYCA
jgi:hypothetical protein